ncbi:hypothetical protein CVT25_010107 [Psilocybe cyanescens]|uniref:DUF6532 domain-containing protein n=1 Tax=Psilocybe cyanescens TaxID=93625 RepID=A0A409XJ45_PSICY|nr:hypothetical protein CVT25_010107 [Psilocybe cyanescens]
MYGCATLISDIITKAREHVKAHYNLSGDLHTISEDIKWLLEKAHFNYGDLNIKEQAFNECKPFFNELIVDLIECQWFPSSSRVKSDGKTTAQILKDNSLPTSIIFLVATAINHALKEWTNGH